MYFMHMHVVSCLCMYVCSLCVLFWMFISVCVWVRACLKVRGQCQVFVYTFQHIWDRISPVYSLYTKLVIPRTSPWFPCIFFLCTLKSSGSIYIWATESGFYKSSGNLKLMPSSLRSKHFTYFPYQDSIHLCQ